MLFLFKVLVTALVVAGISELAKRWVPAAAVLASLPLTSILAILWLYAESRSPQAIISLTEQIFWALLPSLLFFIILPLLLRFGMRFGPAMLCSVTLMVLGYSLYLALLNKLGING